MEKLTDTGILTSVYVFMSLTTFPNKLKCEVEKEFRVEDRKSSFPKSTKVLPHSEIETSGVSSVSEHSVNSFYRVVVITTVREERVLLRGSREYYT